MKKILFIHGLFSSGINKTMLIIKKLLPDYEVISPDLNISPDKTLDILNHICSLHKIDLIVGISLGTFFATKLKGIPKILINPIFYPSEKLETLIGEHPYLDKRSNEESFIIDHDIIEKYRKIEKSNRQVVSLEERKNTLAIFGEKDVVVNNFKIYLEQYNRYKKYDGGHIPSYINMKKTIIPLIRKELKQEGEL